MVGGVHPNNVRAGISDEALRDLYVTQSLTLAQVAARFGLAGTTIRRRLRDLGIAVRPCGPLPRSWFGEQTRLGAVPLVWTGDLAYVVGLMATDGNLSRDGRHLSISSQDVDLLQTVRRCLNLRASITPCSRLGRCHHVQWSDRMLYDWLLTIGLMPAKSLRLGPLAIPDEYFRDFVRGCIDGDGSIVTYVDRFNAPKNPKYVYDRLFVSIVSASPRFLRWIQLDVLRLHGLSGHLTVRRSQEHHDLWRLRWAKRESHSLLTWIYYTPNVPALRRKRERAERAMANATWYRHSLSKIDTQ
jgi:hypothetical protein